jgi:hypothetical protein
MFTFLFLQGCEEKSNSMIRSESARPEVIKEAKKEKENMTVVYDKAKWHYEGDFPEGLDDKQGFVHTGMYLGWIIENHLYSKEFKEAAANEIIKFKQKKMTGTEIYMNWDGVFVSDMLNEEGNAFTKAYFDFKDGVYLDDYEEVFPHVKSLYEVKDTWGNYETLKPKLNERFNSWKHKKTTTKGNTMFTIDDYISSLKESLQKNEHVLIANIKEIQTFHYYEGIDLLDFEIFMQPFDLSIMMFSMDDEANEVFYEGNDRKIFSGSHPLFDETQYYNLPAENSDAFWEFYEQNEESISAAEEETIVRWFVSCWNKAGGKSFELPVYLDFHDDIKSFDLHKNKWIDSEEKWAK